MKKFRQTFLEMQKGILEVEKETLEQALFFTNMIVIGIIYLVVCFSSMIFMAFGVAIVSYIIIAIAVLMLVILTFNNNLFWKFGTLSTKLLIYFFGRYGKVVTKEDWKRIKKKYARLYRAAFSKKSAGHCYFYSRYIALFLKDAKLMYCSIDRGNGSRTGHAIIVKNNEVYCTNSRQHFDLDEYKKMRGVIIYKMFSEKEYRKKRFFEDIGEDFMKWCAEHNSYCNQE